ncbi:FAD-binding oxidoreductase [Allocoleopsis franciscana]|uniref:FAD/FMN-dependent dehydrogenase n=1 Tax=Allocoleopsis franciscana PCC 7113 TaxID=1173027 RepID=K9WMW0_9CYAN|nr:FAD-binding oxidoreductase [Allocoleopsis franciscana]AFZ21084.1 FAD/FMN-dependent dehydrogenase [Allocoleopsis franciscana PCC 7113]
MNAIAKRDVAASIAQKLEPIVGESAIFDWEHLPPIWQERINRANTLQNIPSCIVYPHTVEQLKSVITYADGNGWSLLPCGSGSKLGWGGVGKDIDLVISTERLNRVIEHAVGDLTVTVEAGVKLADLQNLLRQENQFLPLDPAYAQQATLGGIIATADSGSWRHRYGGVRDMLLGISFVRSDGQLAKAGGRVVKNVAGYDLMKLFTGSYGTLGILTEVTLRAYPIPEASGTVVLTGKAEATASVTKTLLGSALTPTTADLLSSELVKQLGLSQGIGLMVRFQSVKESVQEQSSRLLEVGQNLGLQGTVYTEAEEGTLWQSLSEKIWQASQEPAITCKIGVLPTAAVTTLTKLDALTSSTGLGLIHASGLGRLRLDSGTVTPQIIGELRQYCESQGGFLTVLEAPISLKQQLDVWGYKGNALKVMRQIKQQFDPKNILSPDRFVAGI